MTGKMETLWGKLRQLVTYDPHLTVFGASGHRYRIFPCLTENELKDFEQSLQVTLPKDYRSFLLEIANGGAGPEYGLRRLQDSVTDEDAALLARPFPHCDFWNMDESDFESTRAYDVEYSRAEHTQGTLFVSDMGCGHRVLLVVTGEERGTIWQDFRAGDLGIVPVPNAKTGASRISFGDWYEAWLDKALAT